MEKRLDKSTLKPLCEVTSLTHCQVYDWLKDQKAKIRKKQNLA